MRRRVATDKGAVAFYLGRRECYAGHALPRFALRAAAFGPGLLRMPGYGLSDDWHSARCARYAAGDAGVKTKPSRRDFFPTILATAEIAGCDSGQRAQKALALCVAPRAGGLCHRLLLHRIHAAQTAYGLLVQHDSPEAVRPERVLGVEFRQTALDPIAEFLDEVRCQFGDPAFVLGRRPPSVV